MTFSELPLVHDIKAGNRNSEDLMREYNLDRSELTYLCEKLQHEGQISAEDLNGVLLGVTQTGAGDEHIELLHSTVDDEEKRRMSDNADLGDPMFSVTDIASGFGRSTSNASSAGMMSVSASALDTAVGAEVAEAAAGNVVDAGAGVVDLLSDITETGVDVGDVVGGVAEVIGAVIGGLFESS